MALTLSVVINAVKRSMLGTADMFEREHVSESIELYKDIVHGALAKLRTMNPLTQSSYILLEDGVNEYDTPIDFWQLKSHTWGNNNPAPWDDGFVCNMPCVESADKKLLFMPAPNQGMINSLGHRFQYFYLANYVLSEDASKSNVGESLLPLLVLLSQACAMELLIVRGVSKPVSMKAGVSKTQKSAPSAALKELMDAAERLSSRL